MFNSDKGLSEYSVSKEIGFCSSNNSSKESFSSVILFICNSSIWIFSKGEIIISSLLFIIIKFLSENDIFIFSIFISLFIWKTLGLLLLIFPKVKIVFFSDNIKVEFKEVLIKEILSLFLLK